MDGTLDDVALAIDLTIEGSGAVLVVLARDGIADAATATHPPDRATTVAFVSHDPLGAATGSSLSRSLDRHLLQQLGEHRCLVRLSRGQDDGEWLALTLRPEVDFGAEPPLAPAERLLLCPPFPPAAC